MFTPPPSPIPPKRQILPVPEDTPAVAISSQPQPKPAKRRRRGAFVVLVPLILLLIIATARQLIQDDPRVEWIGSLRKRQTDNNGTPTVVPDLQLTTGGATGTATSVGSSPSSSGRPSSTSQTPPAIQDPPLPVPTPFPQPFDVILSFNFSTESCQSFFVDFTRALTFRQCRAFSLLVSSSSAFYEAQANLTTLTAIVGGTCNAPDTPEHCKQVMDDYSRQLESVCAKDMQDRNALVVEAYNGFKSYSMFHEAGCLRNLRTNSYCFVDAAASESPADMYYFTLPIGVPLPKSTVPSCTACTQSVLAVYAEYATNSSLKISETYPEAARRAAGVCGQQYATLVGAAVRSHPIAWGAMAVSLTLAVWALIE